MDPKLVIFDCDGVLVDTERMVNASLAEMVTELGYPIAGPECQQRFMGRTLENVKEMVEALTGRTLPNDWPDQVRKRDLEVFAAGVPAIAGIADVLDALDRRKVPYCVGSSGKYAKMRTTLGSSGLLPRLQGKLFLCRRLRQRQAGARRFSSRCQVDGISAGKLYVVIEDSLPGVQAARSAGMAVYAYVEDPACDREALADAGAYLFDNMAALPGLLFSKP
jgi:beta-phosphoglucomutase-like phosphatase (HAD superfamily)